LESQFNRQRQRLQAVLRDRFGLVLKAETREMPIYALTLAKSGSKLAPSKPGERPHMSASRGQLSSASMPLIRLTDFLSNSLGRFVRDETGLAGDYTYEMKWAPDAALPNPDDMQGASIFTALQEQLGLKLEAKKGPVPVFVVEKIQKPEAN
jgi:uncharacterized protein (TIGR03435 family)